MKPLATSESPANGNGHAREGEQVPSREVLAELDRILQSQKFSHSEQLRRFLAHTVRETVEGRGGRLKEYSIGVEVLHKPESYDPRVDPIVRVSAARLRSRLREYYASEGSADPVRIEYPKRTYTPEFRPATPKNRFDPARLWTWRLGVALGVVISAAFAGYWLLGRTVVPAEPYSSIAVLPLRDISPEGQQDYFRDGMTEALIHALTRVPGLRVVSRSSVFQFKDQTQDMREIGERLRVGTVLEGAVQRAGNSLRVNVQLVRVADGSNLWSERYDRELGDVFAVQEEISRAIVEALRIRLSGDNYSRLVRRRKTDLAAYELFLKGRYHSNQRSERGLRRAIEYFEQARLADPQFAPAYAGLADTYALLGNYDFIRPGDVFPKARAAAEEAIRLDPTLGEAYVSRAFVRAGYDWDWTGAESDFRRGLELDPGYATGHHWYALILMNRGRFPEAVASIRRARELDPLSPVISTNVGLVSFMQRRYQEAAEQFRLTLQFEPDLYIAHWNLGRTLEQMGRVEEAVAALTKACDLSGGSLAMAGVLGHCYGRLGRAEKARELLRHLQDAGRSRYVSPYSAALIYAGLGDRRRAIEWLGRAADDHSLWLMALKVDPIFDELRGEPEFRALLKRMGLDG